MKLFLILLLGIQLLTTFNCNSPGNGKDESKKNLSEEDNFNSYFPLKDGNSWTYINEAPRDESELFNVTASEMKKVEDGIQMRMSSFPYMTKDNGSRTIEVKQNGQIEIDDYMGSSGVIIPSQDNFKSGYEWKFGELTGWISNSSDTVNTESEKFADCFYVMLSDGFTFSYEMWFKKKIGIIKWGANRTNPPVLKPIYYVLKNYKLN